MKHSLRSLAGALALALLLAPKADAGDWREPAQQGIRLPQAPAAERLDPAALDAVLCVDGSGRILAQGTADASGLVELRDLSDLSSFLAAVAAAKMREGASFSDSAVLIQADENTPWDPLARLLAACAGQRLRRLSFAVGSPDGMARIPVELPVEGAPERRRATSVRLSLKPGPEGRVVIAIGRKIYASPAELETGLETLQALFPGLRLTLNVHSGFPYRELVRVLGLARGIGFPGIEFTSFFVEPDDAPLVNTGVVTDPAATRVAELDPRNQVGGGGSGPTPDPGPRAPDPAQATPGPEPAVADPARATPGPEPAAADPAPVAGGSANPSSARLERVRAGGGSEATERAARAGLLWLARHQAADGAWTAHEFGARCTPAAACTGKGYKSYEVGLTALALCALLGGGIAPDATAAGPADDEEAQLARAAAAALRKLLAVQEPNGCVGPLDILKPLYNHALATLALCEALRLTGREGLRDPARRAVEFLIAAQSPNKGWRYQPGEEPHDTSVTGWCVTALAAARAAGIRVDAGVDRSVLAYLDEVTDPRYQRVGYSSREDAGLKIVVPGKNDAYINHDTMTAIGILVQVLLDNRAGAPMLAFQADLLAQDLPRWDKKHFTNDYYYWYYGTAALWALDGPGGAGAAEAKNAARWERWNAALQKALVDTQAGPDAGCAAGSWDADDRWGFEGGRVYGTALNVLTLETYTRWSGLVPGKK